MIERLPDELDSNARVMVRDAGTDVRARRALNLTATGEATLTITDNPTTEAVDVTLDVTVPEPITDHGVLTGLEDDDHPQYQLRSERSVASGYASLDATALVPPTELGSGIASETTFLRGDQTWAVPASGGSHFEDLFGSYYETGTDVADDWSHTTNVVSVETTADGGPWLETVYEHDPTYQYFEITSGLTGYTLDEYGYSDWSSGWNVFHYVEPDESGVYESHDQEIRSLTASVVSHTQSYGAEITSAYLTVSASNNVDGDTGANYITADVNSLAGASLAAFGPLYQNDARLYAGYFSSEPYTQHTYFAVQARWEELSVVREPRVTQCVPVAEPTFSHTTPDDAGLLIMWLDEDNDELKFQVKYSDDTTIKTGTIALV